MTSAMKKQKLSESEDLSIISGHGTQSSNSVREYSEAIPVDLLIDIFSRVSAKSIARFRCVSKFWASVLRNPDFTEWFLTMSSTRPRLLFTIRVENELFFFSSRQSQNSSSLVATRYKYIHEYLTAEVCPPVHGLFCIRNSIGKAHEICNPVTGESITLPKVEEEGRGRTFFGFDPVNKRFKVLFVTWTEYVITHWVLGFEYGKRCLWRKIRNPRFPYRPRSNGICINGALYYRGDVKGSDIIVCFKIRAEKLSVINLDQDMSPYGMMLFNYNGKLGVFNQRGYKLVLWVLGDGRRRIWSKTICFLPDEIGYKRNKLVGMTSTGEIVFSSYGIPNPFYVWFYSIERKTVTRVHIKGFEDFVDRLASKYSYMKFTLVVIRTFIDYVENVKDI